MASLDRRRFLGTSLAALFAATGHKVCAIPSSPRDATAAAPLAAPAGTPSGANRLREPARDVDVIQDAEVIVCGAGPAGVSAALLAARQGAKVRLLEAHGCLGGVWTASLLGYLLDFDKPGLARELVRKLRERDACRGAGFNGIAYEPEEMKVLLEELCTEAGVRIQYHTRAVAAYREGRRLDAVVTESKSGRQAWRAPVFIDATGDGDLGALSGCAWEMGDATDPSRPCQPMSMIGLWLVRDTAPLRDFIHKARAAEGIGTEVTKKRFHAEIQAAGVESSYSMPTLFHIRDNLLLVMLNHEYGARATDAAEVTRATIHGRAELLRITRALRAKGGGWEGLQLVATPEQIGIREGRRIAGRYTVSKEDLIAGARHEDATARATFPVDIHALSRESNKKAGYGGRGVKVKPYDIPLRAQLARDVDGLLLAGRCISGDFIAHASYRVTGNAVPMGEAAGVVAAVAARLRVPPHEVPWKEIAPLLAAARSA